MSQRQQLESEIDLIDYIKAIYKWRWFVLAAVIAGTLYTASSETRKPDMYEASATFFPLDSNFDMKLEGLVVKARANMKDLIMSLLESKKMFNRIAEQLDLKKVWNKNSMAAAEGILKKATEIKIEANGLIRLIIRTPSPELSARIANAYVDNLDYFNGQLDLGAQRNIVQVIDRAAVPDARMPRNITKKVVIAAAVYFAFAVALIFIIDFIQKSDLIKKLKE